MTARFGFGGPLNGNGMLSIVLLFLGIVAIVVFTIQVYKTAIDTGRNAPLWAGATAVIGIVIQFFLPVIIGVFFGIYLAVTERGFEDLESGFFGLMTVINVAGVLLSVVGMWLVMKHVSKIKEDDPAGAAPPPPPTFGGDA